MELAATLAVCRSPEKPWQSRSVFQHCPRTPRCAPVSPAFRLTSWFSLEEPKGEPSMSLWDGCSLGVHTWQGTPLTLLGWVVTVAEEAWSEEHMDGCI